MDAISLLRMQLNTAHQTMEGTMEGVTPEMAHWMPPGRANPIGASYAHVVQSEDAIINGIFKQQAPMFASQWLNKAGFSEPMPSTGPEWSNYPAWTRRVQVDLPAIREFAQAVYANLGIEVSYARMKCALLSLGLLRLALAEAGISIAAYLEDEE